MACIQDGLGRCSGSGGGAGAGRGSGKKPDDTQERDKRLKKQIEELNREIDEAAKVGDNIAERKMWKRKVRQRKM